MANQGKSGYEIRADLLSMAQSRLIDNLQRKIDAVYSHNDNHPDDKKPLEEICNFYNKSFVWAEKEKPLNQMLNEFKTGEKGHLAIVKDAGEEKRAIGIVTLEDIIEEIIQAEIIDEDDVVTDNRSKQKRIKKARYTKEREVKMFMEPGDKKVEIAPQISLAVFQFIDKL